MMGDLSKHTGSVLIRGGRVINPATCWDATADVLIENGVIAAVAPNLQNFPDTAIDTVIEVPATHWVIPGLVDIHVHFRDPGNPEKETTQTGVNAALAGGYSSVCIMPNTQPTLDNPQVLAYVNQAARADGRIRIYPVAAATKGLAGKELTPMKSLAAQGAVGFSDDGHCIATARMMRLALEYAKMEGLPIVSHAEDCSLSNGGCIHEGAYSTQLGLPGYPSVAESVIVARDIELCRYTGGRVHFAHISTRESVNLIRRAKAEGLAVTAETTPHYLCLTDAALADYDADFKMNAPLPGKTHQEALIEGLLDGTLEALATDHAPHTPDEKQLPLDQAPNGVIGLETALAAIITRLVTPGIATPMQLVQWMSTGPAQVMNLPAGNLSVGKPADITIVDPDARWTVDVNALAGKSRNTPFKGKTLTGKATHVLVGGRCFDLNQQPVACSTLGLT